MTHTLSFLGDRLGFYPTREAVQKALGFETATKQPNQVQHYTVTFVLFFFILLGGVTVRSLGKVYGLVGGISATTLAFILPSMAYWVTSKHYRHSRKLSNASSSSATPTVAAAAAAFTSSIEPTLTQSSTLYHGISSSNNTYSGYYLTATEDKQPIWDVASTSSSSRTPYYVDEEDASTVGGDPLSDGEMDDDDDDQIGKPTLFLDIMAVILFIWGFVVMILSVSSVLSQE